MIVLIRNRHSCSGHDDICHKRANEQMNPKTHWCHYISAETSARTEHHLLLIDYSRLFLADFSHHFLGTSFLRTDLFITVKNDKGSGLDHGVKEMNKPLFLHSSNRVSVST